MNDDRKKQLELFAKQLQSGIPFAEDFIKGDNDIENNSLLARNLSEDALAHQVLKNTGIPIPDNKAALSQKEDFLNRIVQERYPEFKNPNVQVADLKGAAGDYGQGLIRLDKHQLNDMTKATGKVLHESGHKYDDEILKHQGTNLDLKTLRDMKKQGLDLKNMDPAEVYERYAKNHHAQIPDLREGTYGMGALKSFLKSGAFKAMGPMSAVAQVTPSIADLKEGKPNTAAARMVTGLAPAGSEQLQDKLMEQATIEDNYPKLKDSTYLRTIKSIGERRQKEGKSPIVEGFDGEQIDTSKTENSDFLNLLEAKKRENSQG